MRFHSSLCAALAAVAIAAAPALSADDEGWTWLFKDGDLDHWIVPEGDGGHWKVIEADGGPVIDYDARSEAEGVKDLVSKESYGDFVLELEWKITDTPNINPNVRYVLPDGTHARDIKGEEIALALPDSDSGVFLRGSSKCQVNIWCWPIGSGEVYGYRMDRSLPPEVRAGVTPKTQADKPVGEWNAFQITMKGDRLTVVLNDVTVLDEAQLPGAPEEGPLSLQHHGGYRDGKYTGSPSLVQFRNIRIKPLD
ncbi:DUF1080 domain-containing protein [Tautonia sp. JC769]|uniref:3-keto-disaccharide hydrolase n=1 Tax=Tautonia sp. JC769 TaxID=3232135 RepID=UPI003457B88F